MQMTNLFESVRYITDTRGERQAVMLDLEIWQEVVAILQKSTQPSTPIPPTEREAAMAREEIAYQAMHDKLRQTHLGQHVAIYDKQVVDYDTSGTALYKRVRQKYPNQFVLITPVEERAEEVIVMRSPRLIQDSER